VPERREERTTEGGLDVAGMHNRIAPMVEALRAAGSRVSLFIEPDPVQIAVAEVLRAPVVELHTGRYAELWHEGGFEAAAPELERLKFAAADARRRGIEPHAGHGLTYETVTDIARMEEVTEISIGHFLISQSVFEGLPAVVRRFKALIAAARGA
jgi:pyridoxine 5-phosphate synthase